MATTTQPQTDRNQTRPLVGELCTRARTQKGQARVDGEGGASKAKTNPAIREVAVGYLLLANAHIRPVKNASKRRIHAGKPSFR